MRLWTLHPQYLDAKGLVALWREGLLAKAVLEGNTRGYRNHPQLIRFREQADPHGFLCAYLREILAEAQRRGYHFAADKLPAKKQAVAPAEESKGQLEYEWQHLKHKLAHRDMARYRELSAVKDPVPHPLFRIVPGGVKSWEREMNRNLEAKTFGLPPGTVLEQAGSATIAIVMRRKSRIIMADGRKIVEKAGKIRQVRPEVTVALKTSAPLCGKTRTFLEGEGIQVLSHG